MSDRGDELSIWTEVFLLGGGIVWTPSAIANLGSSTGVWRALDYLQLLLAPMLGLVGGVALVRRYRRRHDSAEPLDQ
jgi:hypothetical protein